MMDDKMLDDLVVSLNHHDNEEDDMIIQDGEEKAFNYRERTVL